MPLKIMAIAFINVRGSSMGPLNGRSGWRLFSCTACGDVRWIATRDRLSPSGEVCRCGENTYPLDNMPDNTLETDGFGNLAEHVPDSVLRLGEW